MLPYAENILFVIKLSFCILIHQCLYNCYCFHIATPGNDFISEAKVVLFPSNELQVCTVFIITDDEIVEKNETFIINITAPGHVPATLQVLVTITDEDSKSSRNPQNNKK